MYIYLFHRFKIYSYTTIIYNLDYCKSKLQLLQTKITERTQ